MSEQGVTRGGEAFEHVCADGIAVEAEDGRAACSACDALGEVEVTEEVLPPVPDTARARTRDGESADASDASVPAIFRGGRVEGPPLTPPGGADLVDVRSVYPIAPPSPADLPETHPHSAEPTVVPEPPPAPLPTFPATHGASATFQAGPARVGPSRAAPAERWAIRKVRGGVDLPREDFNKAAARRREAGTYYGTSAAGVLGFGCPPAGAQTWLNRDVPEQMARRMDSVEVVDLNREQDGAAGGDGAPGEAARPSLIVDLTRGPAGAGGSTAWRREAAGDVVSGRPPTEPVPAALPPEPDRVEAAMLLTDPKRVAEALVRLLRSESDAARLYARCRGLLTRVRDASRSVGYHQGYADALAVVVNATRAAEVVHRAPVGEEARRRVEVEQLPEGWTLEDLVGGEGGVGR